MKVILRQGDTLTVGVEDGEIELAYGTAEFRITTEMPDTDGRLGIIYSERFGEPLLNDDIGHHDPENMVDCREFRLRGKPVNKVSTHINGLERCQAIMSMSPPELESLERSHRNFLSALIIVQAMTQFNSGLMTADELMSKVAELRARTDMLKPGDVDLMTGLRLPSLEQSMQDIEHGFLHPGTGIQNCSKQGEVG